MARAILLIRLTLVLVGLATASAGSTAGSGAGDSGRKATVSFSMMTAVAPPSPRTVAAPAGASLAPRSIVSNPYNVPLLQNAGSLRSTR